MVLSSVRKLVRTGEAGSDDDGLPEKLLLTPAFRVDEIQTEAAVVPRPVIKVGPKATAPAADAMRRTPTFFGSPRRFTSLEGRIAELERAVGSQPNDFEPDGSEETDDETPRNFVFQHRAVPALDDPIEEPNIILSRDSLASIADDDDSVVVTPLAKPELIETDQTEARAQEPLDARFEGMIDEAVLRELVEQMVRAELQGELGEKITRNVRKLVRREIHRVLLTHDFG